jgi:sulfur-oxidizing protein SoxY
MSARDVLRALPLFLFRSMGHAVSVTPARGGSACLTRAQQRARRGAICCWPVWAATMLAPARASDEAAELIERLTGKTPTESDRLHLVMPRTFPNGYTVPLSIEVDSPTTENDHIRHVRVVAPRNPLIEVASFHFVPQRGQAPVSTRIRLAEPQYVLAVAEMNDGTLLMTKTWVEVATNGCA